MKNLYCGKKNKQPYKGQVVVLINGYTQSKAELMVMAIQAAIPTLTIGSATAGADGDNVSIPLPGGYRTSMSGLGVFYPDGRETQRVGITPDIVIKPTISGIRERRDEVLFKAREILKRSTE